MADTAKKHELISCAEAKAMGLNRYFNGRECLRGHVSERRVSNQMCCECNRTYYRKRPELKEQKRLAYWKKGGREKRRALNLKSNYGITIERYDAMSALQNDCCAICGASELERPVKRLVVDHDHRTDQIRELLCTTCNLGLGAFSDDPEKIKNALKYLKRHRRS